MHCVVDNIVGGDSPMDDREFVQIFERGGEIAQHSGGVSFRVFGGGGDGVEKIAA